MYYVSDEIVKRASNVCHENLICIGVCFGKFTKTKKFHLHVTALDYLGPYAKVSGLIIISEKIFRNSMYQIAYLQCKSFSIISYQKKLLVLNFDSELLGSFVLLVVCSPLLN